MFCELLFFEVGQKKIPRLRLLKSNNSGSLATHLLKIAWLVAHPRKKLKFSMDILTFIAIPNELWKGKGSV